MKVKNWKKKEVKKDLKTILKTFKENDLDGQVFPIKDLIGDYQWDSKRRYIKEALFYSTEHFGRSGNRWFLKYKDERPKELAQRVVDFIR